MTVYPEALTRLTLILSWSNQTTEEYILPATFTHQNMTVMYLLSEKNVITNVDGLRCVAYKMHVQFPINFMKISLDSNLTMAIGHEDKPWNLAAIYYINFIENPVKIQWP